MKEPLMVSDNESRFIEPKWFKHGIRLLILSSLLATIGYSCYIIYTIHQSSINPVVKTTVSLAKQLNFPEILICPSCPFGEINVLFTNPSDLQWSRTIFHDDVNQQNYPCIQTGLDKVVVSASSNGKGIVVNTTSVHPCSSDGIRVILDNSLTYLQGQGGNMVVNLEKTKTDYFGQGEQIFYNPLVNTQNLNSQLNYFDISYRTLIVTTYTEEFQVDLWGAIGLILAVPAFCDFVIGKSKIIVLWWLRKKFEKRQPQIQDNSNDNL